MSRVMTQEERFRRMVETPVSKLIPSLAVPTIISMLITSIYNMADTYFVSQINTSASAAVGVSYSLMSMIQAFGFTLGMGGGNYLSRVLGTQDTKKAEQIASTAFYTSMAVGAVLAVLGLLFLDPLVRILGATDTIAPYAKDYAKYILMAAPIMTGSLSMNNLLRFQGLAVYAMVGITLGGVLNMVLDPILIFGFDMGIAGAAIATALSQLISFLVLFLQSNLRSDCVHLNPKKIVFRGWMYGEILHGGIPSLCRQGVASIATAALNLAANPFGDAAIAAMSIVSRYMMFINSALIGFGQGFQPVCGFNFGARRYDRVIRAFWFCVRVAVVMLTVFGVIAFLLSGGIVAAFRRDDPEVIRIGTLALRLQLLTMPFQAWIIMSNMLTQSIGYGFRASLVAMGRQGLFLIPALAVLPPAFGVLGIQMAQPIADMLTFVMAAAIVQGVLKELKGKMEQEGAPA